MILSKDKLIPGDILLYVPKFKNGSKISLLIAKSENDIETHASIYIGDGMVFESLDKGPQWNTLEDSIKDSKTVKVYRYIGKRPTSETLIGIINNHKLDDLKYNWTNLLSQLLYIKTGLYIGSRKNKSAIICSVLCAKIWNLFNSTVCKNYWTFSPSSWSMYMYFRCEGFVK